jgi:two-component system, OmpR family, sensor histidine kinase KdpD
MSIGVMTPPCPAPIGVCVLAAVSQATLPTATGPSVSLHHLYTKRSSIGFRKGDPMAAESRSSTEATGAAAKAVLIALAACAAVTLVAMPVGSALDHANIVMVYLLAVALVAMRLGRTAGVTAAFASVLLFDFFFVEPRFSLAVRDAQYLITFVVMLVVAVLIATLTARLRREAELADTREARIRALYQLAHEISGALDRFQVQSLVAAFLKTEFAVEAELLLPEPDGQLGFAETGSRRSPADLAVAMRVLETGEPMPIVEADIGAMALALPLNAPVRRRGVLIVRTRERDSVVPPGERPLLDAVAALTSTAVERLHFDEIARRTQVEIESERLRTSVLSAVSHDLRTPLTVVVGLADTLARGESSLPPEVSRIAAELREQAMRLSRMVENLLDMARLRAGRVKLLKAWQPLEEVVGSSVRAVEASFPGVAIRITLADDLPLLEFDGVLVERVLVNLLENAVKHGAGSPVAIRAGKQNGAVEISVEDRGPGLPPGGVDRLFEMFERGGHEGQSIGTGIGLAICKAIVEAHGGTIRADNREGGGARFAISLPVTPPPEELQAALPMADTRR